MIAFNCNTQYNTSCWPTTCNQVKFKIKVCLWNTEYAPGGNKVQKLFLAQRSKSKSRSQGHWLVSFERVSLVESWFPQIMSYLFQGLFKDFWCTFSRTFQGLFFVLSSIHSRKKLSTMDFSNKTYRDHLILSSPEKWFGGGGSFGYVFLTF